jgi:2-methylcitrate dehydratase PrpD
MTLTRILAEFAASARFEQLPPGVVRLAKAVTLDTFGTALAATTLGAGCAEVVAVMARMGGPCESTMIGHAGKVAAPQAAFANGALAHALNYDAVGEETGHTGVACFAAPLALAEALAPVSGERLLTAVVVAAEVTARLMRGATHGGARISKRILSGQYFSYLGAAAGAAHVAGLDAAQTHSAFGLALMQAAGSRQIVIGGDPPAKAIYGAFPSHAGVLAVLLARAGLVAEIDAVDGEAGIYGIATGGAFDAYAIVAELGRTFAWTAVQFKPWATSNHVAPFVEAALDLRARFDLRADDVASVELAGPSRIRDWFEPVGERRRPANAASAANSAMYAVAKALAHGAFTLADVTADGLRDETALALADRITYRLDDAIAGGCVSLRTHGGRQVETRVDRAIGDPSRPLSRERLEAKFRDCASHARGVAPAAATALIALIDRLETLTDVASLTACLAAPA